jgi:thiamine biosynthesis lipoprotein
LFFRAARSGRPFFGGRAVNFGDILLQGAAGWFRTGIVSEKDTPALFRLSIGVIMSGIAIWHFYWTGGRKMLSLMKMMTGLLPGVLSVLLSSAMPPKVVRGYIFHYENVLGTSLELKVRTVSKAESEKAESAVLREIFRLSAILSGYDPGSEFSRWQRTTDEPVRVSQELYEVFSLFDRWRERTGGALDASAEVVTRRWKTAASQNRLPTDAELAAAVAEVREAHWKLDPVNHTATHLDRAPLMLNSFAKSYIIRRAADAGLAAGNIDGMVVNIGGDMVVAGSQPEDVLVSDPVSDAENDAPMDRLRVRERAVATSGNYRRGELILGRWYSHIVDPRTGQPAGNVLSATVVAPSATDAGALATVFNVLSTDESVRLAAGMTGIDYLIITKDGRRVESAGWRELEVRGAEVGRGKAGDYELVISIELNLQKGGAVKRPYLAVWVEDESHAPVRTISVWHGAERYLPELKSWFLKYRGKYSSDQAFASSITSATRPAGKYTLKWDGKDDQGNVVKAGKYVVKIEVSREHGTYQLMRQEVEWNGAPQQFSLPGNVEISSASLDYRKAGNDH